MLFRITAKQNHYTNGIRLEKGMSVEVSSKLTNPLTNNGGKEVIDAFQRVYGIDIKKNCSMSDVYLEVKKVN
jgi:peptidoglycan hydrolase-like protein with peptidoglycan-binding domain